MIRDVRTLRTGDVFAVIKAQYWALPTLGGNFYVSGGWSSHHPQHPDYGAQGSILSMDYLSEDHTPWMRLWPLQNEVFPFADSDIWTQADVGTDTVVRIAGVRYRLSPNYTASGWQHINIHAAPNLFRYEYSTVLGNYLYCVEPITTGGSCWRSSYVQNVGVQRVRLRETDWWGNNRWLVSIQASPGNSLSWSQQRYRCIGTEWSDFVVHPDVRDAASYTIPGTDPRYYTLYYPNYGVEGAVQLHYRTAVDPLVELEQMEEIVSEDSHDTAFFADKPPHAFRRPDLAGRGYLNASWHTGDVPETTLSRHSAVKGIQMAQGWW